jgi:hypothetical protein
VRAYVKNNYVIGAPIREGYYNISSTTRSLQQNAYYHGVIIPMIAAHTGEDTTRTHETLKDLFLAMPHYLHGTEGRVIESRVTRSTASLSKQEFEEYCAKCRVFASEFFGLYIPLPNENPDDTRQQS